MKAPRVQLSSDFASSTIKYFASVNWHIFKSFYDDLCCLSTACFRCQNSKTLKRRATRNFSWAGEISWNRGTSIKASCTTQKKRPRREKIDVFCPRYSTNCILNENLTLIVSLEKSSLRDYSAPFDLWDLLNMSSLSIKSNSLAVIVLALSLLRNYLFPFSVHGVPFRYGRHLKFLTLHHTKMSWFYLLFDAVFTYIILNTFNSNVVSTITIPLDSQLILQFCFVDFYFFHNLFQLIFKRCCLFIN